MYDRRKLLGDRKRRRRNKTYKEREREREREIEREREREIFGGMNKYPKIQKILCQCETLFLDSIRL